jgi:hypothetical protein
LNESEDGTFLLRVVKRMLPVFEVLKGRRYNSIFHGSQMALTEIQDISIPSKKEAFFIFKGKHSLK